MGYQYGNQTSQYFALLYLSDFDHFAKEKLKIKYYGRYVDDFYMIHYDKEYLKYCLEETNKYMESLGLKLNKKTEIIPIKNGVDLLGFHTYVTESGKIIRKLRRRSKTKMQKKLKKFKQKLETGEMTKNDVHASWQSWNGHARNGNTYYIRKKIKSEYKELMDSNI